MPDRVTTEIMFPVIPDDASDDMKEYLTELHRLLTLYLIGTRSISGDLNIGGRIYTRDTGGNVKQLYNDGIFGN